METHESDHTIRVLTRDEILARSGKLKVERVRVPEFGGDVLVRELTARQRDEFDESNIKGRGKNMQVVLKNMRAKLVARSVVDEDGRQVFTEADIEAMGELPAAGLEKIFAVAQRLNGITQEDVDELAGKSVSDPSAESDTSSA